MSTDYRALCAELAERLQWFIDEDDTNEGDPGNAYWIEGKHRALDALTRARLSLAQPEPVGPTDENLHQLWLDLYAFHDGPTSGDVAEIARAALARWGRTALAPIPVSERLPGPEDCDAEGRCWFSNRLSANGRWNLEDRTGGLNSRWYSHWLPHWALPLLWQPAPAAPAP